MARRLTDSELLEKLYSVVNDCESQHYGDRVLCEKIYNSVRRRGLQIDTTKIENNTFIRQRNYY